ncbi:hypothetical protein HZB90_01945 [archaeon]|nr:hypothetical protein [archaeon]
MPSHASIDVEQKFSSEVVNLAMDTIKMGKQALVFVSNKKSAEKCAEDIALKMHSPSPAGEVVAADIIAAIPKPTKQCERLARCAVKGIAFHHSGLTHKQRDVVEEEFRKGNVKIICCTPTLCLSGDTKVWAGLDEKRITDLVKSDRLLALSGDNLIRIKPSGISEVGNTSQLIQISSVAGHSIKVTPNHRMLIRRKSKKLIVPAGSIRKDDKIATVGRIDLQETSRPRLSQFIRENRLPGPDRGFDEDLSYFIGLMLGDGYSGAETVGGKIKYKGSPSIVGRDEEVFAHTTAVCKQLGISSRRARTFHGVPQLVLGKNKWFREFLVRCGVEQRNRKHINEKLLCMKNENIAALLRGLFDTDGYVQRHRNIGFSSISEGLVRSIQKMLLRSGIVCRFRRRKGGVMDIYDRQYKTAPSFEISICQKKSIVDFYRFVGFGINRKQESLMDLVAKLYSNLNYVSCPSCRYKIYRDLFSGRSKKQKEWGKAKFELIKLLGEVGEKKSGELKEMAGFEPKKKELRLNHHYELIKKRRMGSRGTTEQAWSLNPIGSWFFENIVCRKKKMEEFFALRNCPLCNSQVEWVVKKGWRDSDSDGCIFWDVIRSVRRVDAEPCVYDVVLPNRPVNDHLFVADGFIVHNSAGLDMPAFRTIIRDLKRYSDTGWGGMQYIPVLEYLQMAGRAGRPRFDKFGEAICIASSEEEKENIHNKYILGEAEEIYSKLAVEPVLRTYILSLIATDFVKSKKELMDFFSRTFWAFQFKDMDKLGAIIDKMLDLLERYEFILQKRQDEFVDASEIRDIEDSVRATLLGRRVAQLYIDPLTAHHLIKCVRRSTAVALSPFSLLQMVCNTLEMRPLLRVKTSEFDRFNEQFSKFAADLIALFMLDWIDEKDEEYLYEEYDVRPGETRAKLEHADWLLYSAEELSKLMSMHDIVKHIVRLRFRLKYGVREELIPLLRLIGIGRVRARKLYNAGIRDLGEIKKADITSLTQLIGKSIALDIKKQVGEDLEKAIVPENKRKGQISLRDYGEE